MSLAKSLLAAGCQPARIPLNFSSRLTDRTRSALSVIWASSCQPPRTPHNCPPDYGIAREARLPLSAAPCGLPLVCTAELPVSAQPEGHPE
eukprot:2199408-Pyramimonas_sp.AAC.1